MLDLARISQVPLLSLKEMSAHPDWDKRLKYSFAVPARHQQALDKFLACVSSYQNTLPSIIETHTKLYHQWISSGLYLESTNIKNHLRFFFPVLPLPSLKFFAACCC